MRTRLVPVGAGVLALAGAVLLLSTGPAGEGFGWFAQGSDDTFFVESSSVHLLTCLARRSPNASAAWQEFLP